MSVRPVLCVKILSQDPDVIAYYQRAAAESLTSRNSGFDLITCCDRVVAPGVGVVKFHTGIACQPEFESGYLLVPRSSIIKTGMRLANSVGIIDVDYRGEIIAAVDVIGETTVAKTDRYFQLCHPSLVPMTIRIVEELGETARGAGGFGSTGL